MRVVVGRNARGRQDVNGGPPAQQEFAGVGTQLALVEVTERAEGLIAVRNLDLVHGFHSERDDLKELAPLTLAYIKQLCARNDACRLSRQHDRSNIRRSHRSDQRLGPRRRSA